MKKIFFKFIIYVCMFCLFFATLCGCSSTTTNTLEPNTYNNTEKVENYEMRPTLIGSDGKDFFENILCGIMDITPTAGTVVDDYILYHAETDKYSVDVKSNENNEILYVKMVSLTSMESNNFFMASTRINYDGIKKSDITTFIINNVGKTANTKIGNANFKFSKENNGQLILEILAE